MIYGEGKHFRLVRCADDEEWLAQRREGIGGSDVAAIMGVSPWRTPLDVWLDKCGYTVGDSIGGRPNVEFGNVFEPYVARRFSKSTGFAIRRVNAICQSIGRPWALASIDYEVMDDTGEWGVLEIKTARSNRDWGDEVPVYYQTQVVHYMSVMQRRFAYVCVFFRDSCEYAIYRLNASDGLIQSVDDAVDEFWRTYVQGRVMPQSVLKPEDAGKILHVHMEPGEEFLQVADESTAGILADYMQWLQAADDAARKRDRAKARLKAAIGDHKGIECDGRRVTWVRSQSKRFDSKAFKADHPDLYEQYQTMAPRDGGLRIKEID